MQTATVSFGTLTTFGAIAAGQSFILEDSLDVALNGGELELLTKESDTHALTSRVAVLPLDPEQPVLTLHAAK